MISCAWDRSFIHEQKRSGLLIPVSAHWVAQCFIVMDERKRSGVQILRKSYFRLFWKVDFVFVSGHRNWLNYRVGIEMTWFRCWRRNYLDFCVEDWICLCFSVGIWSNLFFVWGIEVERVRADINVFWVWWSIDLMPVLVFGGRNWLGFWIRAANPLILVWASRLTWFCLGDRYWLSFSLEIAIDLFCVWRSNTTEFHCLDRSWLGFGVEMFDRKYIWILDR